MIKRIATLMFGILTVLSTNILAEELPNLCSRDKNMNEFTVLSYHEVAPKGETLDSTYTVSPEHFKEQVEWLIQNGFHFISVQDILDYRLHDKKLPDKAVLMTFDDGYQSVYTNAFPLMKHHRIPFVIALVGSWMKTEDKVDFAGHKIDRDKFMSQKAIQEMVASGLVEVASHSYASHNGVIGNPQGNTQPAMTARKYLLATGQYEDERSYKHRIHNDLSENNQFLESYTGQKPRVIVWPYGHYNIETRRIAETLGMSIGLTLDDGSNTKNTPLWGLRRILVDQKFTLRDLEINMWMRNMNFTDDGRTTKAAHIDLDYIYDPDPVQQEKNLGDLLERIKKLNVNTIYLQAFADPDANGAANYVYFPNRHLPMRADLFNRVAWQIATRTQVKRIYAWMPLIAWELPSNNKAAKDKVVTLQVDSTHLNMGYPRLSPFSPRVRHVIRDVYEDLSKHSHIDGIIFHDDVTLSDYEDDSLFARKQYKLWGLANDVPKIRANRDQFLKWTRLKTKYLDDFAMELADLVRQEQPGLKTARNLYAQVALNKDAQEWYSQSLSESIKHYDYTAIMAMPYMEQADDHKAFYKNIVDNVKAQECGLERTVMEIQTVNWRKKDDEAIAADEIDQTYDYLYGMGVHHVAYYPDNQFKNIPDAEMISRSMSQKSLRMFPNPKNSTQVDKK